MQIKIGGKHLEITEGLRNYATEKIEKLERFFRRESDWANIVLGLENGQFLAEVSIGGGGTVFYARACTPDMYASIDEVSEKLKKQIKKYKEKLKAEKKRKSRLIASLDRERLLSGEEYIQSSQIPEGVLPEYIVRRKIPLSKPMFIQEAKAQLDLSGNIFLVFYNAENNQINVIYKRNDGRYGLFEP